jgi:methylated-DNA-[protein]-cysteine S-methyltransferase
MGQRVMSRRPALTPGDRLLPTKAAPQLSVFLTDLGWFGLLGADQVVWQLRIGHISAAEVRAAFDQATNFSGGGFGENGAASPSALADWFPELRERLQRYARGEAMSFDDVNVQPRPTTEFQRQVVAATRQLQYGQTVTYGTLAERVGSPRAARAVGSVMAANRVPIIIPCHRVLAAGGRLGGFSAPQGIGLKERMLAMERSEAG